MPLVNMSASTLIQLLSQDEFAKEQFNGYVGMLKKNKGFTALWKKQHPGEITEFQDYANIFNDFRSTLGDDVSNKWFKKKPFTWDDKMVSRSRPIARR